MFLFCLRQMLEQQQLHRVAGALGFSPSRDNLTALLGLLLSLTNILRFLLLPASPAWSPVGMIPAPEGTGAEQAMSLGVDWGQQSVLGRSGRRCVY